MEVRLNAGYPLFDPYPNDPFNGPIQAPTAQPINLFLARGVGGNTEVNGTLSASPSLSLRLGSKTLVVGEMVPTAVDYGVSLPFNIGFDAGVLFNYPSRVSSHTGRCAAL